MRFQGFIGPSYTLQSVNVDCQRCVNLYPEIDELGTGKEAEVASLVSTPGLRILTSLPTGPVRGSFTDSTGQLWAVGGNVLYKISSGWSASAFGTLNTSTGFVSFSDNGIQAVLVDGPFGYYWTISELGNSATGTVTATGNPSASDTLTIAGTAITFVSSGATGNQVLIGSSSSETMQNLLSFLQGSSDSNLTQCAYTLVNLVLTVIAIEVGTVGNTITLSASSSSLSLSGSTLSGGGGVSTFTVIEDDNFLGADQVTFIDGYFVFNKPGSQEYYLSPLNAVLPFNGADVGSAEANPDNLIGQIAIQENLYLFGNETVEIHYDSGNANFPFQRIQGAVMELGCAAAFSIAKFQNSVYWLGQDSTGQGVVYRAQGLQPQRISNFAVESAIAQVSDLSSARAWCYQQEGHAFYVLNVPGLSTTWVFDITTNLWHERAYLSQGQYQRHLGDCHSVAYNTNVVGDYSSGNLYALDPNTFTDNGRTIVRERTAPHIAKDINRIFYNSFQLDVETGVGLSSNGIGSNPQAILQWSNDGGHSWSNEHWTSIGAIGARKTRAVWRRLGHARDRVFRVKITDPVKVTMVGAELDLEEGAA